jgi:hypothetical protein
VTAELDHGLAWRLAHSWRAARWADFACDCFLPLCTQKLGKLRERRGAATRRIKPEEEVPDSTLTFLNDLKPKYGNFSFQLFLFIFYYFSFLGILLFIND